MSDNVVPFRPLKNLVALVACDGCGAEWEDLEAATHSDGYSAAGCPHRCGRLTTPVYWPDEHTNHWRRA